MADKAEAARGRRGRIMEYVRRRRQEHAGRGRVYRISIVVAGFTLVAMGIVLALPLVPGPGLLVLALGLALLALEFDWAERMLDRTLHRAERLAGRAAPRNSAARAVGSVALALAAGAAAVAMLLWGLPFYGG